MEQRLVELARRAVVDVLDCGLAVPQPGRTQSGLETRCVAAGGFAVEQEGEPFGVREIPRGVRHNASTRSRDFVVSHKEPEPMKLEYFFQVRRKV